MKIDFFATKCLHKSRRYLRQRAKLILALISSNQLFHSKQTTPQLSSSLYIRVPNSSVITQPMINIIKSIKMTAKHFFVIIFGNFSN